MIFRAIGQKMSWSFTATLHIRKKNYAPNHEMQFQTHQVFLNASVVLVKIHTTQEA